MATFKKVLNEGGAVPEFVDSKPPALAKAPGPTFRGVLIGRDSIAFGGGESTMTGWASFYVEVRDGEVVTQERISDPGPKNVAVEAAKIKLITKVIPAIEE